MFLKFIAFFPIITCFHIKYNYNVPFICEIHDIDINNMGFDMMNELKYLFTTTPILVFKNQHITPSKQFDFCSQFDSHYTPRVIHPFLETAVPKCPQIAIRGKGHIENIFGIKNKTIHNRQSLKYNRQWHQDLVGTKDIYPNKVSSIYMIQTPERGGNTLFASMEKGYNNLIMDDKKLALLKCCYSVKSSENAIIDNTGYQRIDRIPLDIQKISDLCVQPLVIYPDKQYNKNALMLSPNRFIGFLGIPPNTSRNIMNGIMNKYVLREDNIAEVVYDNNDLIIFNNRKVIHSATPTEEIQGSRLMSMLYLNTQEPFKSDLL